MDKINQSLLKFEDVTMQFGGLKAVDSLSFDVKENEILGIIGPNGAGKTTVFNCLTQFYKDYEGKILYHFQGEEFLDLNAYPVTDIIDLGIVRTFQNIELVPDLSVIDNVLIGAHTQFETGVFAHIFRTRKYKNEERTLRKKAMNILEFMNLDSIKDMPAGGQPYGTLKRIEIARTLMNNPKLIILDEPAAGLNESETRELAKIIYGIQEQYQASILVIEHDMSFVMDVCDRVCAINFGKFIAIDTPKKIQNHPEVQKAYLGEAE